VPQRRCFSNSKKVVSDKRRDKKVKSICLFVLIFSMLLMSSGTQFDSSGLILPHNNKIFDIIRRVRL
jgi:hypothetical protein